MEHLIHYLKPGIHLSEKHVIQNNELAIIQQTGNVSFASTPSLIILMEQVICKLIHDQIPPEFTSVSAEINIKHLMAIPEGTEIMCSVHLKYVDEKKLFFDFAIFNEKKDIVAIGAHERCVVEKKLFPNY
jgi:predicted thioesterase